MRKEAKKWLALIKGRFKTFLYFFISTFILIYGIFNFGAIYKNIKYEIEKRFPGKVNIWGEAAIIEMAKSKKEEIEGNILFIPKIKVEAPIIIPESNSKQDMLKALKNGVIFHPNFSLPDKGGLVVIEGHSSPNLAGFGKYNNIFALLGKLEYGDEVLIYYNKEKYKYKVFRKIIFKSDENIYNLAKNEDLFLITCWPVGTNFKKIGVSARLIK